MHDHANIHVVVVLYLERLGDIIHGITECNCIYGITNNAVKVLIPYFNLLRISYSIFELQRLLQACDDISVALQVEFSPRRLEGFCLTDEEAIERLWSYLRGFSAITKEMSASRRKDLLTDAPLHLSKKNFENAGWCSRLFTAFFILLV